ncbi:MAG TPA: SUMF1/EgtB/PvdO family nonheme iron enzyme [Vicinamibacteria bacterium]|nr:SUMF1/EgtB/PvdO family nonheme iron enzyme [Vicinamibacteria bacterium]
MGETARRQAELGAREDVDRAPEELSPREIRLIPAEPARESVGLSDENPWPGLLPFGEADWKYFHGRDFETDLLFRKVERERLTVLFGLSGLGKSSILQAGLFPLLRRENVLPIYVRLDFSPEKPDLASQVKNAILWEAERSNVEAPTPQPKETLWEYFHRNDADFWSARHRIVIPLLVFDQFEEVFTLGARDRSRQQATNAFLLELADLVEARPPLQLRTRLELEPPGKRPSEAAKFSFERHRYKVLVTLREDFLPDLEALGDKMGSVSHNRFRLERMNGVAALQAVNQAKHIITAEVAERVVRFVAAADPHDELVNLEVEPALLSVVCGELNSQRLERREAQITERALEGSQNQILSNFYERSIADLSEPVCTFVEEKLLTRRGFRNLVVYDEALGSPGVTEEDIEELVKRRLVRIEERARRRLLELSHDLLTGVVTASRDERRRRQKEADAVRKLEERHRRSLRSAALLFMMLLLGVGALGAFAWAYLAEKQADALARAKDEAERSAAEASNQRAIAESRQLEADRQRQEAEKARELAEMAAVEASRQQKIADVQREDALWQRHEAVTARSDAERATEDALLQKNLAEEQRRIAQARQSEVEESQKQVQQTNDALVEALRERLSSRDAGEVLGALAILDRGGQDPQPFLARIDARWFQSARDFVPLVVALDERSEDQPSERWSGLRSLLVKRFSEEAGIGSPPSAADRIAIAGSEILMGEPLAARVRVAPFYLQPREVTNGEYRRFDPSHEPGAPADHPVVNVSWYDAMAYAAWLGGTLPSEPQWELAARGASGRMYPWGNERPSRARANYDHTGGTMPVGSFPEGATPERIDDLAGNVWEWCRDSLPNARVLKGGSFFNDETFLVASARNSLHPEGRGTVVGFRVAWMAEP